MALLMAATSLPLHASIPRASYLSTQIATVASVDASSQSVVEQDVSTESLCAPAPLREIMTQSGNNEIRTRWSEAETIRRTSKAKRYFSNYLTDHVGTVLRIVTESGTVNQYDYDAFGRVRSSSETVENRYLFQGREWDKNGGFYYFRNRIYLPERGEFASPDMNLGRGILGELDGMATLTFCGGDPVNCVDPTGLAHKESAPGLWDNSVDWGKWVADDWWELPLVGARNVLDSALYCYENLAAAPVMAGLGWVGEKDEEYGVTEQYMNLSANIPGFGRLSGGGAYALQRSLSFARTTVASAKQTALLRKIATTANKTLTSSPKPVAPGIGPVVKSTSSSAGAGGTAESLITNPSRLLSRLSEPNAGGYIRSFVQEQDQIYYRVFSGDKTMGSYLTAVPPRSSAWAQEALSLPKGNTAQYVQEVLVPAGTRLQRSRASAVLEWGRVHGGGEQFQLLDYIPTENFGTGKLLP